MASAVARAYNRVLGLAPSPSEFQQGGQWAWR